VRRRALKRELAHVLGAALDRGEKKVVLEIKKAAARGDMVSAKILAKEVAQTRKAKTRMYTSKAQLNSIGMQLQSSLGRSWMDYYVLFSLPLQATMRIAGCMQQSTAVLESLNQLVRLPQLHNIMMAMAKEMEKVRQSHA
jgi:charged multivesicular body protein 3